MFEVEWSPPICGVRKEKVCPCPFGPVCWSDDRPGPVMIEIGREIQHGGRSWRVVSNGLKDNINNTMKSTLHMRTYQRKERLPAGGNTKKKKKKRDMSSRASVETVDHSHKASALL